MHYEKYQSPITKPKFNFGDLVYYPNKNYFFIVSSIKASFGNFRYNDDYDENEIFLIMIGNEIYNRMHRNKTLKSKLDKLRSERN